MRQLRFVALGGDSAYLVLADAEGQQYTVPVDERLRAAVRGDIARLNQLEIRIESSMRPAEIQARIRSGQSVEEVARAAGLPADRVERYAGPVLQERARMAYMARQCRLRWIGDDLASDEPLLGDVADERLLERGVSPTTARWDAGKREDGTWQVTLTYGEGRTETCGTWVYDPMRRLVTADDPIAHALSDSPAELAERQARGITLISAARPKPLRPLLGEPDPEPEPAPEPEVVPEPADEPFTLLRERPGRPMPKHPALMSPPEDDEDDAPSADKAHKAKVPSWDEIIFGVRRGPR
jgi:hypothetical protein